jgi:hypothetical protein
MNRATLRRGSQRIDDELRDLAMSRVRFGYLRLTVMLSGKVGRWERRSFIACIGSLDCR